MFEIVKRILKIKEPFQKDKIFTKKDLEKINNQNTILIINGKVYDVTDFLEQHPGGSEIIKYYHKKDATQDFIKVGHSNEAINMLDKYQIGIYEGANKSNSLEVKKLNKLENVKLKLFTHEDKYFLHKFFAMMVLIHIFIVYGHTIKKTVKFFITGNSNYLGKEALEFNSKIFFLFCHSVLALSSLIFHVPDKETQEGPMISKMIRAHTINFSFRSILAMYVLIFINDKYNEKFIRIFIVILSLISADLISFYSNNKNDIQHYTTINSMASFKFSKKYQSNLKDFYALSQFLSTITTFYGTYYDIFSNLIIIQLTAFLKTLRRKNLITTENFHYIYILFLLSPYLFIPYFTLEKDRKLYNYHVLFGMFLYFLRRQEISKYYIWFPVLFYYLYSVNPKSKTNIIVAIIMILILIILNTRRDIFFQSRKNNNNIVLTNKKITDNSFELIIKTRIPIHLKPGQHILIKYDDDLVRKYTPTDSKLDDKLNQSIFTLKIKKYDMINNKLNMSTYLSKLKKSQTINLQGPLGGKYFENNMIIDNLNNKKYKIKNENIILFSAGSGITPIYQLAKNILKNTNKVLTLVTCDKNESDIMIKYELDILDKKYNNLQWIKFLSQENGRITEDDIINLTENKSLVIICGPDKWNQLFTNKNLKLLIW